MKKLNKDYLSASRLGNLVLFSVVVSVLSGCDNRVELAGQEMVKIRNSPSQTISKPPKPEKVEDFVYSASKERSPFLPPSFINYVSEEETTSDIKPDITRKKEELENYQLDELIYRGILIAPSGEEFGLVQRPDGSVTSVKVGGHMGVDYGRIVEITATQINLIEIVPDNRSGFVEKPKSLVSPAS